MAKGRGVVDIEDEDAICALLVRKKFNEKVFRTAVLEVMFDSGDSVTNECRDSVWGIGGNERLISGQGDCSVVCLLEYDHVRWARVRTQMLAKNWLFVEVTATVPLPNHCIGVSVSHDGGSRRPPVAE